MKPKSSKSMLTKVAGHPHGCICEECKEVKRAYLRKYDRKNTKSYNNTERSDRRALAYDWSALHRYLYRRRNRLDTIDLNLKELAEEIDVSAFNLSRVIARMCREGKLRKLGHGKYVVYNPEKFS